MSDHISRAALCDLLALQKELPDSRLYAMRLLLKKSQDVDGRVRSQPSASTQVGSQVSTVTVSQE